MPLLKCAQPDTENTPQGVLPYGRQSINEDDIAAVVEVLRSPLITTGPRVAAFEEALATTVGATHGVAVSSGTAALHCAMYALNIGPGDEVIVPTMTFAGTANAVVFQGGTPVFADVEDDTLLLDATALAARITPRTRAIVAVDYAGQPCDYDLLRQVANKHNIALVADACHALGGAYKNRPVGSLADMSVFSFHAVKHITTGEGGMVTTDDPALAERMRIFRNHGITADYAQRRREATWFYEMVDLGYNYRITDLQCALGISQLSRLESWIARRQVIAQRYDTALADLNDLEPLSRQAHVSHAYHLYVIRVNRDSCRLNRAELFALFREQGIGVNVHYIPVHLHPYYRNRFGYGPGDCPVAEAAYEELISLPMFAAMSDDDVERVIETATRAVAA